MTLLAGQVALITGASGGVGRGIALRFAQEGAQVALHCRTGVEAARELARRVAESGSRAVVLRADLSRPDECRRLVREAAEWGGGRLTTLVNNAGVQPVQRLEAMTAEDWRTVVDTNLTSVFACTQAAAEVMRGGGGEVGGGSGGASGAVRGGGLRVGPGGGLGGGQGVGSGGGPGLGPEVRSGGGQGMGSGGGPGRGPGIRPGGGQGVESGVGPGGGPGGGQGVGPGVGPGTGQGVGRGGAVIHIASVEAGMPAEGHAHYSASKAAVVAHARAAAREYGAWGIRVNTVSPGLIEREGLAEAWPDGVRRWREAVAVGRLGRPEDVGDACVFLASPLASWITGHDLVVDGGVSARTTW
ncbi:SDR family NAD(P)-dependent oxidoreductase [Streptomyces sp. NPDC014995]|uniref:SDR family NAD(P)-dependent oxidoreductase n=1 Tax=Streptomyces sp. NPDC014995 TaxID=3364936 RepID=UPI0036FF0456